MEKYMKVIMWILMIVNIMMAVWNIWIWSVISFMVAAFNVAVAVFVGMGLKIFQSPE